MNGFKLFFEMSSLRNIIGDVPQRPDYHYEGPVFKHSAMVRTQLEKAIGLMQNAVASFPSLSNLDVNYTDEDRNLLRMASWVHDLGKASATKINPKSGKLQAIGHEQSYHFKPMAKELLQSPIWEKMFNNASLEDKKLLWFLVNNHMSHDGLSKRMNRKFIDRNGKYFNDRRLKLLFTFVLMDTMGRISGNGEMPDGISFLKALEEGAEKIKKQNEKVQLPARAPINPSHFVKTVGDNMRRQGWVDAQIYPQLKNALRKKSDKDGMSLSDEQIDAYVKNYLAN